MAREVEVDLAYTLLARRDVVGVWAFDAAEDDEYRFAVEMNPYSVGGMVEAHYEMLGTADRSLLGSVLYFASERPPPFVARTGRRVRIRDLEWFGARRREQLRTERRDLARDDERKAEVAQFLSRLTSPSSGGESESEPAAGKSGVWRVIAVHPDPFPARRVVASRILVIDDRESTLAAVARIPEDIDVVPTSDGWSALERMKREHYDIIVCAIRLGEWSGRELVRMACAERPELAPRIVYLADANAVSGLAPNSVRGRVLCRPLNAELLVKMAEESRLGR